MEKKDKKRCNKIVSLIATLVLVVSVCFCVVIIAQILGKGYVTLNGYSFFRVVTPSMEPNLSVGEVIITDDLPMEDIQVGDVISFRSMSADMFGTVITHRVIDIERDEAGQKRFLTKGDANLSIDGKYVVEENFVGKVIWSSGNSAIQKIFSFVSGRYGFLACVVFPTVLILAFVLSYGIKSINNNMKTLILAVEENKLEKSKDEKIAEQSYDEMYQRIRNELIEELKNSEGAQKHKTE